ncbi:hypothetical protein ACVIWV_005738 [Bradyrhizobium diazoefficiens]
MPKIPHYVSIPRSIYTKLTLMPGRANTHKERVLCLGYRPIPKRVNMPIARIGTFTA